MSNQNHFIFHHSKQLLLSNDKNLQIFDQLICYLIKFRDHQPYIFDGQFCIRLQEKEETKINYKQIVKCKIRDPQYIFKIRQNQSNPAKFQLRLYLKVYDVQVQSESPNQLTDQVINDIQNVEIDEQIQVLFRHKIQEIEKENIQKQIFQDYKQTHRFDMVDVKDLNQGKPFLNQPCEVYTNQMNTKVFKQSVIQGFESPDQQDLSLIETSYTQSLSMTQDEIEKILSLEESLEQGQSQQSQITKNELNFKRKLQDHLYQLQNAKDLIDSLTQQTQDLILEYDKENKAEKEEVKSVQEFYNSNKKRKFPFASHDNKQYKFFKKQ